MGCAVPMSRDCREPERLPCPKDSGLPGEQRRRGVPQIVLLIPFLVRARPESAEGKRARGMGEKVSQHPASAAISNKGRPLTAT